jgi:hypothetical protein
MLAKVETEIAAFRVSCLPVKQIEVAFVIEVAEAVLDALVTEILVICW